MSIAATQSYGTSPFQRGTASSAGAAAEPRTGSRAPAPSGAMATAGGNAVSVELSDEAKAMLAGALAPPAIDIPKTLDEIIQKRSDAFTEKLTKALKAMGIPDGEEFTLTFDSMGRVKTDSPYKKKIEEYFENDPEAAKELKAIASLHALKAAQEALALYIEEKKAAKSDDEKAAAFDRHTAHSINIQKLSGILTFKDGALSSAAREYVDALKPPDAKESDAASRSAPVDLLALLA
jgi:hypothetical protein